MIGGGTDDPIAELEKQMAQEASAKDESGEGATDDATPSDEPGDESTDDAGTDEADQDGDGRIDCRSPTIYYFPFYI